MNAHSATPAPPPQRYHRFPVGTWGISYDMTTHAITDLPPDGYGYRTTAPVYRSMANHFERRHFQRSQKSVWISPRRTARATWTTMMALRHQTRPIGVFPAAVQELFMFRIVEPNTMTVS